MNNPLVSVIIPTFNRAHLIGETLDSVLAQTYENWECIVVDDGSTDNTDEIIESYVDKDGRFQYHHRPENRPKGGNAARNYGFEMSTGDYVNFFDSDDIMHSEKLQIQIKNLKDNPDADFALCQSGFFKTNIFPVLYIWNDKIFNEDPLNSFILKEIGWSILAPLWRKAKLKENDLIFDENLSNGQDFKFHIDVLLCNLKPFVSHKILVYARMHNSQIKSNRNKAISKSIVFKYLHKNKSRLNTKAALYVKNNLINIINKLYLEKNSLEALRLSSFIIQNNVSVNLIVTILKITLFGNIYCLINKGYSFLSDSNGLYN